MAKRRQETVLPVNTARSHLAQYFNNGKEKAEDKALQVNTARPHLASTVTLAKRRQQAKY